MNNELTTSDLKDILTKRFSADRVQYGLRTTTRVRKLTNLKRLDWCSDCIKEETFDNVIFTDESTILLEYHRRSFRKNTPRKLKYRHKHPFVGRNIETGSHPTCGLLWDHEHHQIHPLCL